MWLSVDEFKLWNDVEIDDESLAKFIDSAEELFKAKFFIKKQFVYYTKRTEFEFYVEWYLADRNRDWKLDENDVLVYKISGINKTPLSISKFEYMLYATNFINTITQVVLKPSTSIKFEVSDYDYNDEKIVVEFFVSPINFEDERHKQFVKQYINYLTQQLILRRFLLGTMEGGITSWSLNGVSVSTSPDIIQNQIKELNERMLELITEYGITIYDTF